MVKTGLRSEARSNLALTSELRKLKEAEASNKQAITLKPDYADAFWNLGLSTIELILDCESLKDPIMRRPD